MVWFRFDLGSTSKILNLSLLRFNERSGSENLDINSQRQEQQLTRTCFIVFNAFLLWFLCVWVFWGGFMIPYQSSTCFFLKKKKIKHMFIWEYSGISTALLSFMIIHFFVYTFCQNQDYYHLFCTIIFNSLFAILHSVYQKL